MVLGQRRRHGVISHVNASGTVPTLAMPRQCGRSCPVSGASAGHTSPQCNPRSRPLAVAIPLGAHVPGLAQRCSRLPGADVNGPNASGIVADDAVTVRQQRGNGADSALGNLPRFSRR
jgi:hypothetical protein